MHSNERQRPASRATDWRADAAESKELWRRLEERRAAHTAEQREDAIRETEIALLALRDARDRLYATGTDGFMLARELRINVSAFCDLLASPGLREPTKREGRHDSGPPMRRQLARVG